MSDSIKQALVPFVNTGATPSIQVNKKHMILENLTAKYTFDVQNGIDVSNMVGANVDGSSFPVIFLINGVGGCGKDTFVEEVGKHIPVVGISSIDPVVSVADVLIHSESNGSDTTGNCSSTYEKRQV